MRKSMVAWSILGMLSVSTVALGNIAPGPRPRPRPLPPTTTTAPTTEAVKPANGKAQSVSPVVAGTGLLVAGMTVLGGVYLAGRGRR